MSEAEAGDTTDPVGDEIRSEPLDGRPLMVLREIRGLTQEQLVTRSGVSRATISRIENGEKGIDRDVRAKLAHGLDLPASTFDDALDFIRYVDRLVGRGSFWATGRTPDRVPSGVASDEVAEGAGSAGRAARNEQNRRVAEAFGRSTKDLVLRLLDTASERPSDDY